MKYDGDKTERLEIRLSKTDKEKLQFLMDYKNKTGGGANEREN